MAVKPLKYRCPECLSSVAVTPMNKYRKHSNEKGETCRMAGQIVPVKTVMAGPDDGDDRPKKGRDYDICPLCDRKPTLDGQGAFNKHMVAQGSTEQCKFTGLLPDGSKPPSLSDPIQLNGGVQEPFGQGAQIECPNPECGRKTADVLPDGTMQSHMRVEWGDKVCPMSGHKPADWPLPESPMTAPILDDTTQESAPPISVDVPDTPYLQALAEDPGIQRALASVLPDPEKDEGSTNPAVLHGSPMVVPVSNERLEDERAIQEYLSIPAVNIDSRGPNSSEQCEFCSKPLGGTHTCYPRFVRPGAVCDPVECADGGHTADPECEFHTPFVPAGAVPKYLDSVVPMGTMAERLTASLREMFYAYSNRMARSVQETLGPSEIGTPCDRRLAMTLLKIPPVNPGGDNWASFVGTCIHTGLAEMFVWADANQGRFAVEVPLEFPSKLVPKGTSDLLDRVLCMVDDHKAMGRFSLDKLRTEGIKPLYRVQLMVYAYGQKQKGERVTHVAVIAWPREQATLKDLYAVVEPYDESVALDAFARVEEINRQVAVARAHGLEPLPIARDFGIQNDCTYCPFYAKNDSMMERGCNGKR